MRGDMSFQIMVALLVCTAVVWWVFCLAYHLRSKWWKNEYGRNLMSVGATIACLYTMLVAYVVVDQWTPWFTEIASVLLLWSSYAAVRRIILMDRAQRHRDDRR